MARNGLDDTRDLARTVTVIDPVSGPSQPAPATPSDPHEFRFQLDHPVVMDDAVPEPVVGRMVIEGWALARSGVEAINVFLDGRSLGLAYYGTARRDVEAAFPNWTTASPRLHLPLTAARSRAAPTPSNCNSKQSGRTTERIRINTNRARIAKISDDPPHRRAEIDLFQTF